MKKWWLIGGGVALLLVVCCVGGVGGLIWTVYRATAPLADAADQLFAQIARGDVGGAYASTASALRARHTEEEFADLVEQLGLTGYVSSSWPNRHLTTNEATVTGTVQTRDGRTIPLTVKLVHEGGKWRVSEIQGPLGSAAPKKKPR